MTMHSNALAADDRDDVGAQQRAGEARIHIIAPTL